jgi:NADH-quinone oxidoreductase subunit N
MSLIYGISGSLDLREISAQLGGTPSLGLILGVAFIVVATAFKFGAAPFHMWVPDVYQGAPTSVTLLVATAPKIASFALAFRLLANGLGELADSWTQMLAIIAILSIALGNVVAIAQTSLQIPLQFDFITPGAKSLALAGAFAGLADDATASFTNPAGLMFLEGPELSAEVRGERVSTPFLSGGRFHASVLGAS